MKIFEGTLDSFSVGELLKWAESGKKTGGLTFCREGTQKTIFFQKGKLVFASSEREGERTAEFFTHRCGLDRNILYGAIKDSIRLHVPFTEYLISRRIVDKATLTSWIKMFIETILSDALCWTSGTFTFTDELPTAVVNGSVAIDASAALASASKKEHPGPEQRSATNELEQIFKQIVKKISENNLELPVIPAMTHKLRDLMQDERSSLHDIAQIIMSDQILTSKILKVANSVFYSSLGRSTSLQQAIITMGFNIVQSIATVHALNAVAGGNAQRVGEVLSHSLLCAFIAQKAAADIGIDPEEFFVCSLLHDIGKTVLLNMVADYDLPEEMVGNLLDGYHQQVGSLLVLKWNFSDVIWSSVLYHHHPWDAPSNRKMAEAVWLADRLTHGPEDVDQIRTKLETIDHQKLDFDRLLKDVKGMADTIASLQ
jgi:putative nucleotidyltransferase with HDIG domain